MRCKKLLFFFLIFSGAFLFSESIPLSSLTLKNGAKIENGVLLLNGKNAYAVIPGTEKFNISEAGLTLACSVKLADNGYKTMDAFFSKPGTPFHFARYGVRLASDIRGKQNKTAAKTRAEKLFPKNQWTHVAVTYEYFDDTAQGETGYITTLYLNGEILERGRYPFLTPKQSQSCLELGKGYSTPWFLKGQVTDIFAAQKALSPAAVSVLAQKSKGSPNRRQTVQKTAEKGIRQLPFKEGILFLRTLPGKGSPVARIYDIRSKRNVLQQKFFSWQIRGTKKGSPVSFQSDRTPFQVRDISSKGFTAVWKNPAPAPFEVISRFTLLDDGLTADLEIKNLTKDLVIQEVVYPEVRIPLSGGKDVLFYPYMCGAEIPCPAKTRFRYGQSYTYPSANVSMQYSACYADGRGVFLGWQDENGTVKDFSATGRNDAVDMVWRLPAALPLEKLSGGNDFRSPGKIAFRLFSGAWYEAAMLHKEWALSHARWTKNPFPRKDTPRWLKRVPAVLAPNGTDERSASEGVDQLIFLRKYLQLPIYAMWFNWYDSSRRGWPAFPPQKYTRQLFKRITDAGCYIEPYTDGRLWDTRDVLWQKQGLPGAVKKADGSVYTEQHGKGLYGVMCPAFSNWQDVLCKLSRDVASLCSAVYHDQVSAARGGLCFDKTHGHALNDPALWLKGYRQIYEKIHAALPEHPQISEDMSEPYLDLFDGGHVWRWGFQGAVPAFQAIYGGRTQYFALVHDKIQKGEKESNFAKMAYCLVNGLKIGRMEVQELFDADEKRLFFKKMSHLYAAVCDYFNDGVMLAPLRFAEPVKTQQLMWSGHWRRNEQVTTPVIESRSYQLDGKTLALFVNPTDRPQTCRPLLPRMYLCREGAGKAETFNGVIQLPPRSSAVAVSDRNEALRIQKTLNNIASFDAGLSYGTQIKFPPRPALKLKKGELAGPDKAAGYFAALRAGKNGRFFGNIKMGAVISWGIVDFGKEKADIIYLHAGVDKRYAGSTITILTRDEKGNQIPAGTHTMSDTGGWMKFKKIPVKLARPLTGKAEVALTFDNNGCCNLLGWEYGSTPSDGQQKAVRPVSGKPLLTAGIMTDTHINEQMSSFYLVKPALQLFKKHKVDMVIHMGDFANVHCPDGYKLYRKIFNSIFTDHKPREITVFDGHDAVKFKRGYPDMNEAFANMKKHLEATNDPYDKIIFKGYTFLVYPFKNDLKRQERETAEAVKNAGDRPVFVLEHHPPFGTTATSRLWGSRRVRRLADKFPQVIRISGHSHGTLWNERNIWQGNFTTVNAGCLFYWPGILIGTPARSKRPEEVMIMEVYQDKILFRCFSVRDGFELRAGNPWCVPWPFDPATAPYSDANRQKTMPAAEFPADAVLKPVFAGTPCTEVKFKVPEAVNIRSCYIYKTEIRSEGKLIARTDHHSSFWKKKPNAFLEGSWSGGFFEEGKKYTVSITPVNFAGKEGRSLTADFTAPAMKKGDVRFECKDPQLPGCKVLTATGKKLRRNGAFFRHSGDEVRIHFPQGVWKGKAGDKFRFTIDLETVQQPGSQWTLRLRNSSPVWSARYRMWTLPGKPGSVRYCIDFEKKSERGELFLQISESFWGQFKVNYIKIERFLP